MADNFQAEAVDSGGIVFATDENTSSVHYPLGKIVWGALNTFNVTDTASPFPVRLYGNSSSAPFVVTTDSGAPPTVAVSGYVAPSTTVTVSNAPDTTVTVTGYTAPSTTVTVTGYVAPSTTVTVTGFVAPSTTVTVSNIAANDTVVTVTQNSSSTPQFVTTDSGAPPTVAVSNIAENDTTVTATISGTVAVEPTSSANVGLNGRSAVTGGLSALTLTLSSLAQTVMTASGRLYGWSVSNPDTVDNAWFLIYPDDSAGVTLGTSSASIFQMVPFGGGREASWPVGVPMSSGMSIAAAATAGSTVHDTPAATLTMTVYYLPSS